MLLQYISNGQPFLVLDTLTQIKSNILTFLFNNDPCLVSKNKIATKDLSTGTPVAHHCNTYLNMKICRVSHLRIKKTFFVLRHTQKEKNKCRFFKIFLKKKKNIAEQANIRRLLYLV